MGTLTKLRKRFSFRWTNLFATSRSRILSVLAMWVCNKAALLKRCCQPRFHSSCHGKRPLTCSTCSRIYQQEFTNNNNLSYHVSLMISKTLNRFQNIGKAINLRVLHQHFQNFELGKKISSSYIVSIIFIMWSI